MSTDPPTYSTERGENPPDPIVQLVESLRAVIHRARAESDIPLAAYIGALEMVKLGLFQDEVVPK